MGKKTPEVTEQLPSLFEELNAALDEGIDAMRKGREIRRDAVEIPEPAPDWQSDEIVAMRKKLHLSQSVFAHLLNVSLKTVQAWEHGARNPDGAARRLLQVLALAPQLFLRATTKNGTRRS